MEQQVTEYVAGFMFSGDGTDVALVRKNRPAWQAGKYNGIGGHIEAGETPIEAMVREFEEETGVKTEQLHWKPFVSLGGDSYKVHFFYTGHDLLDQVRSTTDEPIMIVDHRTITVHNSIPNLTWLIPMVKSLAHDRADRFHIQEIV